MKQIEKRKADHIEIALEEKVCGGYRYWDDVKMVHCALPEVDMSEIDTSCQIFGKKLAFPLIVTAITGGYPKAEKINSNLAEACQELQIGMGVGSERAAVENGADASYTILKEYDVPLRIGNVGAPQLIRQNRKKAFTVDQVKQAMEIIDADVMAIHLNFLQEVAQPEGDTNAKGCLEAIRNVAREVPSIIKETGAGISHDVAMKLKGSGIIGMDISGTGGTSFSAVERFRAERLGDARCADIGKVFSDWGDTRPGIRARGGRWPANHCQRGLGGRAAGGQSTGFRGQVRWYRQGGAQGGAGLSEGCRGAAHPYQGGASGRNVLDRFSQCGLTVFKGLHRHGQDRRMDKPEGPGGDMKWNSLRK